jgi:2'-hydroxyisoflavone reductase
MHRRTFVRNCLFVSARIALARKPCLVAATPPKRILVLGGTLFLGPAFVETALAGGHTVTLFNRGITNVWPHDPVVVESAAQLLKDRAKHYLYVSSIGAYAKENFTKPSLREDASLTKWDSDASFYNRGKAESERRLGRILGHKLTVVRPGPIKGVRDDTPDVLVWLKRLQKYSTVAAPGDGKSPVEIVDVKDVAEFLMLAIDRTLIGTFNLTGRPMSFLEFLASALRKIGCYPSHTGIQTLRCAVFPKSVVKKPTMQAGRLDHFVIRSLTI